MSADVGPRTLLRVISELMCHNSGSCFLVTVTVRTFKARTVKLTISLHTIGNHLNVHH